MAKSSYLTRVIFSNEGRIVHECSRIRLLISESRGITRMALAESRAQVVLNPIGWMTKSGQIKQTNWLLPQEQIEDQ